MRVIAGDIGGTTARLALAEVENGRVTLRHHRDFSSGSYPDLAPIVREFLAGESEVPLRACFGVPCPIVDGVCEVPNLRWRLELEKFRRESGLSTALLVNDFAALGYAIPLLQPADVVQIKSGTAEPGGTIALVGAGTGLGQGALFSRPGGYEVVPSEGGHADYAPRTDDEIGLLDYLRARHARVSWERVLSGPGILNLYQYLVDSGFAPEQPAVRAAFRDHDPAAVITGHARAGTDPLSVRALELFVSAYGAQAGNLALIYRALGGVYLGGGIAPRILPMLLGGRFAEAFLAKGRLSPLLGRIPVYVVVHPAPGLIGAASLAADPGAASR